MIKPVKQEYVEQNAVSEVTDIKQCERFLQ